MEVARKSQNRIESALEDWSKLVKKSCFLEIEQMKKKHTTFLNQYKPEKSMSMENVLSYQHTKNICLLASEIIRRNGVSYLIIDFLKQMLFLRGFFALTKDTVMMQLTRFSTYMKLVEVSLGRFDMWSTLRHTGRTNFLTLLILGLVLRSSLEFRTE